MKYVYIGFLAASAAACIVAAGVSYLFHHEYAQAACFIGLSIPPQLALLSMKIERRR